jgi:hypothetical protein
LEKVETKVEEEEKNLEEQEIADDKIFIFLLKMY